MTESGFAVPRHCRDDRLDWEKSLSLSRGLPRPVQVMLAANTTETTFTDLWIRQPSHAGPPSSTHTGQREFFQVRKSEAQNAPEYPARSDSFAFGHLARNWGGIADL
ncbi:hypothetical protein [Rhodococcus qingshengii]|uniref:hypothetical protein n=1 Tax=Rhodococcus qingshengii TaxID=334542 RepID=UPI001BEBB17D|nr:hypothetical protein [Rhodococcus qingshengii]MBT2274985.1 hypothetical protein [Rhodococcus qingshengii]